MRQPSRCVFSGCVGGILFGKRGVAAARRQGSPREGGIHTYETMRPSQAVRLGTGPIRSARARTAS